MLRRQQDAVVDIVDKQLSYIIFADAKPTAETFNFVLAKARAVPLVDVGPEPKDSDKCHRCGQSRDSSTHDYDHGFEERPRANVPKPAIPGKRQKEPTDEEISKAVAEAMQRSEQLVKDALRLGRSMSGMSEADLKLIIRGRSHMAKMKMHQLDPAELDNNEFDVLKLKVEQEAKDREEKRKKRVLEESNERLDKLNQHGLTVKDLLDLFKHDRTSCSDEDDSNGWYSNEDDHPRCAKCALLQTIKGSHPYDKLINFRLVVEISGP